MFRRWLFELMYWLGRAPWDRGVSPPELLETLRELEPGRALDLGCGTGTHALTLARHGWQVVGVDFSSRALREARRKARAAGLADRVRFVWGDVTRLERLDLPREADLILDIGCFHGLPPEDQPRYALGVVEHLRPGGLYLLYTFAPVERGRWKKVRVGVTPQRVREIFGPYLREVRALEGTTASGVPSCWFWWRKEAP